MENTFTKETVNVKRRLGLLSGVSFITGSIIGDRVLQKRSGIFISPKGVLSQTGSVGLCLLVWAACGVISMCAALVYAELGILIPKSGSEHGYFLTTYGSFPAFMFVWVQAIAVQPGSTVVKCLTMAEYLSDVLFDNCGGPETTKKIMAATAILTIVIANCISVRLAARVQIFFTFIKVSGLIVIIVGGIIWLSKGRYGSLETGFSGTTDNVQNVAIAIFSGLWAYDGWGNLNYAVEEIKHPKRNLPLAIVISVTLVTVVYLLVNISYLTVLTKHEFLSSWAVGVTWGEKVIGGAVVIIPIVVACSVFGSSNSGMFFSGRLLFAAARENHFPEIFSYIHVRNLIPVPSVIFVAMVSLIMLIFSEIRSLLNVLNFLGWLFYALSMIAVIILRFKMKDVPRVIKVPIAVPVVVLLICLYLIIAPFIQDPKIEFLYTLAFLGAGVVVYVPFVFFKLSVTGFRTFTTYAQLLLESVPTNV